MLTLAESLLYARQCFRLLLPINSLTINKNLSDWYSHYLHFTDEELEAGKS